ncbi:MAG: hypothetical protein CVU56_01745 [Deltaproteobacteria bacterium HGW-Deltaproteobacteria-14]|jgi:hypothetical protein|nr:MAG: hypothetical protein CVU56_01745 [Deltaproteobacteria bacterium HGW-Deltaproteobacteria-14]
MAQQIQRRESALHDTSNTTSADRRGSDRSNLRGLSYAEGVSALSPDNVQLMPDASASVQKRDKPGDKGGDKEAAKNAAGPPARIEALGLPRKITVHCPLAVWDQLDKPQRDAVIEYLEHQKYLATRKSSKLKRCVITISAQSLSSMSEQEVADLERERDANTARLNGHQTPTEGASGMKVIGVDKGEATTIVIPIDKVKEVPVMTPENDEAVFPTTGSTFDSAKYEPSDMQNDAVFKLLDEVAAKIQEYLAKDPNAQISVSAIGSESQVPNPPSHPNVYDLAKARSRNAITLAQTHFARFADAKISYGAEIVSDRGPAWEKPYDSHADKYTQHQYVQLKVSASMMVDSGETTPVVEHSEVEEQHYDPTVVTMDVERSLKLDGGGNLGKNLEKSHKMSKRRKGGTSSKKWKPIEYVTTKCTYT